MTLNPVLIIDDDAVTHAALHRAFAGAALPLESVTDGLLAMDRLKDADYSAVVLDPIIHHRLNGYAVLNFIEMERPETIDRLFLLTGMSQQTITRTAPALLPRLFRKPSQVSEAAEAILAACYVDRSQRSGRRSVLLVEDDRHTAQVTSAAVEELGYAVKWVTNGSEALEALCTSDFDGVMLDLVMPEIDGFVVLDRLQSIRPELLRRVIVTTGLPDRYADRLDARKICGVIQKPLDIARLEPLLRSCSREKPRGFEPAGEIPSLI